MHLYRQKVLDHQLVLSDPVDHLVRLDLVHPAVPQNRKTQCLQMVLVVLMVPEVQQVLFHLLHHYFQDYQQVQVVLKDQQGQMVQLILVDLDLQ